jgi:FkbM family methyltransferase
MLSALFDRCTGAFVDVGVNIGQTMIKVVTTDRQRTYVGFEPSLAGCYYVERLIAENNLENCMVLPLALSSERQAVDLHFSREADGAATIVDNFWSGKNTKAKRRTVWAERGDAVLEALSVPSLGIVKIDVEGAELDVLLGLRETLECQSPFVLIEVLPYTASLRAGGSSASVEIRKQRMDGLLKFLDEIAYTPFRYGSDGTLVPVVDFDAPDYDAQMCNYLLVPRQRRTDVELIAASYSERLLRRDA